MKKIILLSLLQFTLSIAFSQGSFDLNVGTARSELKNNILRLGVNYAADAFGAISDRQVNGKKSLVAFMPEFSSEEGSEDAFSSIVAKVTGFAASFKKTTIGGIQIPDLQKTFHVFPFSAGVETNGSFSYANMIIEAGYFPWYYQPMNKTVPDFFKHAKAAFFLQAGYKFLVDTANAKETGGAKDESEEELDRGLFRTKLVVELDTKDLMRGKKGFGLGLIGGTNLWYDIVNGAFYYKITGKARLYLDKNYYFDLQYEKGSGAPNFNQGDQFGVNLGVKF